MVEDDMDYVEAAESTVGKRKFLINRVAEIHKDIHPTSRSTSSRVLNEIIDQMILNQTKYLTVGSIWKGTTVHSCTTEKKSHL